MRNVLNFWLNKSSKHMHIRADAIFHNGWAVENHDGLPYAKFIRKVIDGINPEMQIIGEVWNDWDLRNTPIKYNQILKNTFDFYNVFSIVDQIREGKTFEEINIDECYEKPVTLFSSNHDCSRAVSMLDNDIEKVKLLLKVIVEKGRDNDSVSIYYGTEANMQGLIWDCPDTVVRQTFDTIEMAKVIQDKESLFYYIKDLITRDKERRGIK